MTGTPKGQVSIIVHGQVTVTLSSAPGGQWQVVLQSISWLMTGNSAMRSHAACYARAKSI